MWVSCRLQCLIVIHVSTFYCPLKDTTTSLSKNVFQQWFSNTGPWNCGRFPSSVCGHQSQNIVFFSSSWPSVFFFFVPKPKRSRKTALWHCKIENWTQRYLKFQHKETQTFSISVVSRNMQCAANIFSAVPKTLGAKFPTVQLHSIFSLSVSVCPCLHSTNCRFSVKNKAPKSNPTSFFYLSYIIKFKWNQLHQCPFRRKKMLSISLSPFKEAINFTS